MPVTTAVQAHLESTELTEQILFLREMSLCITKGIQVSFNPSGRFIATIAATDQKYVVRNTPKPAAFALVIQCEEDGEIDEFDGQPVHADEADENEAFASAVKHLLDCSDERSQITLRSGSAYIVDTINKHLTSWKANGWRKSNGKPPEYVSVWIEIDRLINEKGIFVEAVHMKKARMARDFAFLFAKELAVGERDIHGRKIGAPLSGFGPVD